ncbi:hypothetical protein SDC9_212442 [bioreactor metagenome]|uniref:Uncharacterized protein n=1 Tax=bioreactor metagenome TaxID=1076179 RepID=A0A645JMQ5_9ZZZZ
MADRIHPRKPFGDPEFWDKNQLLCLVPAKGSHSDPALRMSEGVHILRQVSFETPDAKHGFSNSN